MVTGNKKLEILSMAHFFVLPSYQEGDSIAVKEAMACGLPVLSTPACHFNEVEKVAAGLVIEHQVHKWREALTEMYRNESERTAMGRRGCALINSKYTWSNLASKMLEFYAQALLKK